ncbi:MAG TPA: chemotaxis protein CheB [Cytophagaceae bacterium]|nr:chemotaxis protein CheB [Cytophagaceae bacterium]
MKATTKNRKQVLAGKKENHIPVFTIVAIGASVGGLEAVSQLLQNLPVDTGMAFIYVQHLSRDHKSSLPSLLSAKTKMHVQEIKNMELMKPDNVYIIPHNRGIKVTDGHIKLVPLTTGSAAISIDVLFCSLAETHKENVIGVILSGNAHDGTIGLKAIKEAGGLTFAQDESAQAGSMPRSAVASGVVDFILSPKEIARRLASFSKHGFLRSNAKRKKQAGFIEDTNPELKTIFELLHKQTGVDFSHYKIASIKRRLHHKMFKSGAKTIKEYTKLLLQKNDEIDNLYKDLLINITSFFRDTETFQYLKTSLLPKLLKSKTSHETLRIWVPACSTGEEAYSIAMLIAELQDSQSHKIPVQIFATDLSELAIRDARIGKYSQSDMMPLSSKRIKRFFTKTGDHYHIVKSLREMCIFAPHNILRDPPFFRMDFISCRNLLIYFDIAAQKKVLAILHFALNEGKFIMLGKSENTGTASPFFTEVNNKYKIYSRKKNTGVRKVPNLIPHFPRTDIPEKKLVPYFKKNTLPDTVKFDNIIDSFLLLHYMPACAIINRDLDIIQFRGSTSLYLTHSSGKASLNILKMTRPECSLELRNAIYTAIKTKQPVRKADIEIKIDAKYRKISLEVNPLNIEWEEPLLLIVFAIQEQEEMQTENGSHKNNTQKDRKIKKLTEGLKNARTEIFSVIELQERAYEELQAANEEIVSTNEEFQTLNEELETSKEEIEATNEELISTNHELKMHNELLAESYDYSQTIIETIHEPMIILDKNLHVKSANNSFYKKFLVTKKETEGSLFFELGNKQWNIPKLREMLENIFSKNSSFENFEVTHMFPGIGEKIMLLNASRIIQKTHREKLILLAIEDITERMHYYIQEKKLLKKDIRIHEANKIELEKAVMLQTKQFNEKNIELENANKDLTSFTYISSHDLQEPLRKIQNFVSCLLEEENQNLSNDGKKYLQKTYQTANRMQALIEDLLIYSGTKNIDRKFEKTDLTVILNEVTKDFEEIINTKKAVIKSTILCEAHIIPFQFRQLIKNLISNSLKFSKTKVTPVIIIKSKMITGSKAGNKKLSPTVNYCHISYHDNGIGFEPQYNERIFEVFQRLHSQEEYNGTGMGLAICKRIVENHNGIITATGILGKGAAFDIYIPVL